MRLTHSTFSVINEVGYDPYNSSDAILGALDYDLYDDIDGCVYDPAPYMYPNLFV